MALETWYKSTLALPLASADTTLTVATAPTCTKWRLLIEQWSTREWVDYTWVSWTTITWLTRWLSQTADPATWWTWSDFIAWATVKLVLMHDQILDKQNGSIVKVYADATARDADITSPSNWMSCYLTSEWVFSDYQTWAWANRANGSTANASETVAWKVEIATDAEIQAQTDTWWTWAKLSVLPSQINPNKFSAKTSVSTSDILLIADSDDSNISKKITISQLKEEIDLITLIAWEDISAWETLRNWRGIFSFSYEQLLSDTEIAFSWWATTTLYSFTPDSDCTVDTIELYWSGQAWAVDVTVYVTDNSDVVIDTSDTISYPFSTPTKHTHTFTSPTTLSRDVTYKIRVYCDANQFNPRVQSTLSNEPYYDTSLSGTEDNTKAWLTRATDTAQLSIIWMANDTQTAWNTIEIDTLISSNQSWLTPWSTYYLSDTPWAISDTPWSNSKEVWKAYSTTQLLINLFW